MEEPRLCRGNAQSYGEYRGIEDDAQQACLPLPAWLTTTIAHQRPDGRYHTA